MLFFLVHCPISTHALASKNVFHQKQTAAAKIQNCPTNPIMAKSAQQGVFLNNSNSILNSEDSVVTSLQQKASARDERSPTSSVTMATNNNI